MTLGEMNVVIEVSVKQLLAVAFILNYVFCVCILLGLIEDKRWWRGLVVVAILGGLALFEYFFPTGSLT